VTGARMGSSLPGGAPLPNRVPVCASVSFEADPVSGRNVGLPAGPSSQRTRSGGAASTRAVPWAGQSSRAVTHAFSPMAGPR
jgi:hypothetical protein